MNNITKYYSAETKHAILRKLKISWATYWVIFLTVIVSVQMENGIVRMGAPLAMLASAIWLASVVAESASASGDSPVIWGCGTFFLGPVGAIVFPLTQFAKLRLI